MIDLAKAFEKIDGWLRNSKTGFLGYEIPKNSSRVSPHEQYEWEDNNTIGSLQVQKTPYYSMVDLYGFPPVSRIFYL